jgi:hypothetical protein
MPAKIKSKYLLSGFLLLIVLMPYLSLFCLQVKLVVNRIEMLEKLEEDFLQTIVLSPDELTWIVPGSELKSGSRLFDVKEMRNSGGKIFLTGIFDDEEENLDRLLSGKSSPTNDQLPLLMKLLNTPLEPFSGLSDQPFAEKKDRTTGYRYTPTLPIIGAGEKGRPPRRSSTS